MAIPISQIPSATKVIARLLASRLLQPLRFDAVSPRLEKNPLFSVGLGTNANSVHPVEILHAFLPSGVVCYMSALDLHGLTSQPVAHHHIARIETAPARLRTVPRAHSPESSGSDEGSRKRTAVRSLGQWQLTYQGVPYYLTLRAPQNLQAYQTRQLSDKSRFRVTTLEQTLLDTLLRPQHCGGPAVVFEAWEAARDLVRPPTMTKLIEQIGDPILRRRAGFMMEHVGIAGQIAPPTDTGPDVSLLAGVPYAKRNARWRVLVP